MNSAYKEVITGILAFAVILAFVLILVFPIQSEPSISSTTYALSNVKQIAITTLIYQSDYDERFLATSAMPCTRAVLMPYIKNSQFFDSRESRFGRPQFNFNVAGVTSALTPYPGTKQLEPTEVAVWSNHVYGQYKGIVVSRADSSAKSYRPEKYAEVLALFEGQFDRRGVVLMPADYLADQDPLKEMK
ncbi:MAG: hypothetical protein KF836_09335 [Fimbriimonadaceae bacterium]|nr:hypothetical protein [Fimbriimonadaceae bacterium]